MNEQDLAKAAVLLFVIYYFFVRPYHSQSATLAQLGVDSDDKILKYFITVMPFVYALRNDLGLSGFFEALGINEASRVVNL